MADCTGVNTLFSINNASAEATIAHITFWSDWSVAVLDFDIFLTGYDVQTINLCEVFGWGNLPITADEGRDPDDTISPHGGEFGDNPQWDGEEVSCANFFPFPEGILQGFFIDRIQNAHAGFAVPGFDGECMGAGLNGAGQCSGGSCPTGTVARGYITVDQVNECSIRFAGEQGYFETGDGIAGNDNVLWGDYFIVDPANDFAQGEPLVHIEAHDGLTSSSIPLVDPDSGATVAIVPNATNYTHYGRYTFPTGADNREPLGSVWGARYLNGSVGDTSWTVWRDSTQQIVDHVVTYACGVGPGSGPDWLPMNETEVVCFNETEDAVELCFFGGGGGGVSPPPPFTDPACFPYETGRYTVGVAPLDTPFDNGWCYLNLNLPPDAPIADVDFPYNSGTVSQSYVTAIHSAQGRFSVGVSAVQLRSGFQETPNFLTSGNDIPHVEGN